MDGSPGLHPPPHGVRMAVQPVGQSDGNDILPRFSLACDRGVHFFCQAVVLPVLLGLLGVACPDDIMRCPAGPPHKGLDIQEEPVPRVQTVLSLGTGQVQLPELLGYHGNVRGPAVLAQRAAGHFSRLLLPRQRGQPKVQGADFLLPLHQRAVPHVCPGLGLERTS